MILTGSCYCGHLEYRIEGSLGPVMNCHCSFCRRIHGAAFTTIALVPSNAVSWLPSSGTPARFETRLGNVRQFCGKCASPVWNFSPALGLSSIIVSSLADADQPSPWAHVNIESKAPWLVIADSLPQFSSWPDARRLEELVRQHPGAWCPEQLTRPAV